MTKKRDPLSEAAQARLRGEGPTLGVRKRFFPRERHNEITQGIGASMVARMQKYAMSEDEIREQLKSPRPLDPAQFDAELAAEVADSLTELFSGIDGWAMSNLHWPADVPHSQRWLYIERALRAHCETALGSARAAVIGEVPSLFADLRRRYTAYKESVGDDAAADFYTWCAADALGCSVDQVTSAQRAAAKQELYLYVYAGETS